MPVRALSRFLIVAASVVAALAKPLPATAHPHAWIDLRSTAVVDADGRMVAIEQHWLFGDFYSAYILEDIKASGTEVIQGLRDTARANLIELAAYDYFTKVRHGAEAIDFANVETFETGVINGRVYLAFRLDFLSPLDLAEHSASYAVYDPTYYIEVLHAEGIKPDVRQQANACRASLTEPDPTYEQIVFASSLDQDESGGNGLGEVFAEWVTVECP